MVPAVDRQRGRGGEGHRVQRPARVLGTAVSAVMRWYTWLAARTTLYTRSVLGVTAAICLALLIFGASEAWLNHQIHVQVQQVQSANARLRQDTASTLRQAAWAESPAAIEGEARAMGYARPGEQPVVIVTAQPTSTPLPTPTPTATPSGQHATGQSGPSGQARDIVSPLQILFGG
jgi:cell division protein FtsB